LQTFGNSKKRRYQSFADLIEKVESGSISASEAKNIFESQNQRATKEPSEVLESFANLDHARADRCGFPEAIFSSGKTAKQIATILDDMAGHVNKLAGERKSLSISQKAILATR
jgi:NCAIR mutase (PurE)-related protein